MCSVTAAVWPHTVSLLLHRSSRVTTAATGSAKGAQALLRPRVNNNPSAFTTPPLRNQQHCVTRQITSQRPPTPAQTLYVLALVVLQLPPPNPLSILFVRWKLGVKNGCVFQQSHGALSQSLSLSTLR